ncbi:efflux RND transporter periplasmic adaptor subunit [bacterium]|nr:efflux RND transporter periplasmic adaptor subunit [bacterium]
MKRTKLVLLVILLSGLLACGKKDGETNEVQTGKVELRKIIQKVPATGTVQPVVSVEVSANVSGTIVEMAVEEGDFVQKGQLLLQIDKERLLARVQQSQASVNSAKAQSNLAKANLEKAKLDYERSQKLAEKNLISQSDLDGTKASYEVSKSQHESSLDQVAQAEASLSEAKDDLSKSTIYAAMSGTISRLNKKLGERVIGSELQGDVIMVIADLTRMEVEVEVDENDIIQVTIGQEVEIEVDAFPDQKIAGKVTHIGNSAIVANAGTQDEVVNFKVEIAVNDKVLELRPGMSAAVEIITQTKENTVAVPIRAVAVRSPEGKETGKPQEVLFVVSGEIVQQKEVQTGINDDEFIEIVTGANEGEEIVTGSYKLLSQVLKDSSKVKVNNEKPKNKEKEISEAK